MAAHARGNPIHTPTTNKTANNNGGRLPAHVARQRTLGAVLMIAGVAGMVGGVFFAIEAPRFKPVPVVFLTFWLVMVIVGRVFFTGLDKLRTSGVSAPAPAQIRAAAGVVGIVAAVSMFTAFTGNGGSAWAICPGDATCPPGPGGPTLTFDPPTQQPTAPGGQQGSQGGQQDGGIATSPAGSGGNGDGIQAQTPQFGTPGQQAPNIPGNEQPGQGGQQQGQQPQQTGTQNPVRTTAPGRPDQTPTSGPASPSQPTATVTETQSQCPAPGAAPGAGGAPGAGQPGGTPGDASPTGDGEDGPPSWAYLVGEATGIAAGRRRNPTTSGTSAASDAATEAAEQASDAATEAAEQLDQAPQNDVVDGNTDSVGGDDSQEGTTSTQEVALASNATTLAQGEDPISRVKDAVNTAADFASDSLDNVGADGNPLSQTNSAITAAGEASKKLAPAAIDAERAATQRAADAAERAAQKPWYNPSKIADKASSALNSAEANALGKAGNALTTASRGLPWVGAATTMYQSYQEAKSGETPADKAFAKGAGSIGGAMAGAAIGTALFPGVGTVAGLAIGAGFAVVGSGIGTEIVDRGYDTVKSGVKAAGSGIAKAASKLKFW